MADMILKPNEKLDVRNILKDLDKYELQSSLRTSTRSRFQSSPLKSLPADLKTISEE